MISKSTIILNTRKNIKKVRDYSQELNTTQSIDQSLRRVREIQNINKIPVKVRAEIFDPPKKQYFYVLKKQKSD